MFHYTSVYYVTDQASLYICYKLQTVVSILVQSVPLVFQKKDCFQQCTVISLLICSGCGQQIIILLGKTEKS